VLLWFPGWVQACRAVVPAIVDVIVLGQRWNHGGSASELRNPLQDDLRPPVVELYGSVNFDCAACQLAYVSDILQVRREDHNSKRARRMIFTEVDEVNALVSDLYSQNFAGHAFGFPDMLAGFVDGNTVRGGGENRQSANRDNE